MKKHQENMTAPVSEPIFANTVKPRSHTIPVLKRGSDCANLKDSPRDKLRKAFNKKLVVHESPEVSNRKGNISKTEEFLDQFKVKDLKLENRFHSEPIMLSEEQNVEKVIEILFNKKISCVPVVRESTLLAVLDIADIVVYCCGELQKGTDPGSGTSVTIVFITILTWSTAIVKLEEEFASMPLSKLLITNNWQSIDSNSSVLQLLSLLSDPNCGRVAVTDGPNSIGVLSRLEVIQFLNRHRDQLQDKLQLRLTELAVKITDDAPPTFNELVCYVFKSMWKKQMSGLLASAKECSSLRKFLNLVQWVHSTVSDSASSDMEDDPITMEDTLQDILEAMSHRSALTVKVLTGNKPQYLHFCNILQVFKPLQSS